MSSSDSSDSPPSDPSQSDPSRWEVRIIPTAMQKLQSGPPAGLPSPVAFAALKFINGPLLLNPRRVGKPLQGELAGKHVARRGDYRVIYLIDEDKQQITVFDIGYRGHVYHRR